MPQSKYKVFVHARFDVIWQKLLDKIQHPEKYVDGIGKVQILESDENHVVRLVQWNNAHWQELKELVVADKSSGIIVYRLIDHPSFEGETVNICRTTNQVYISELEYTIDWKLKSQGEESSEEQNIAQQALEIAVKEMKRVSEEAESIYSKP